MTAVEKMRPERVRSPVAAAILGVEVRTVQSLAARGELPGAVKIGKLWTFDESALRTWLREQAKCLTDQRRRNIPTGEVRRYGRDLPLQVANSVKACEQALQKLRRNGSLK